MLVDTDLCSVRWCREVSGHDCPHRDFVYDANALDVHTLLPVVLQVVRQGESARTSTAVLVIDSREVALTVPQARALVAALLSVAQHAAEEISA